MGDEFEYEPDDCLSMGHAEVTDYEDEDVWQGHCSRCGAELYGEK